MSWTNADDPDAVNWTVSYPEESPPYFAPQEVHVGQLVGAEVLRLRRVVWPAAAWCRVTLIQRGALDEGDAAAAAGKHEGGSEELGLHVDGFGTVRSSVCVGGRWTRKPAEESERGVQVENPRYTLRSFLDMVRGDMECTRICWEGPDKEDMTRLAIPQSVERAYLLTRGPKASSGIS